MHAWPPCMKVEEESCSVRLELHILSFCTFLCCSHPTATHPRCPAFVITRIETLRRCAESHELLGYRMISCSSRVKTQSLGTSPTGACSCGRVTCDYRMKVAKPILITKLGSSHRHSTSESRKRAERLSQGLLVIIDLWSCGDLVKRNFCNIGEDNYSNSKSLELEMDILKSISMGSGNVVAVRTSVD